MKAATWIGVRPDCTENTDRQQKCRQKQVLFQLPHKRIRGEVKAAQPCSASERGSALYLSDSLDGSSMFQQELHHFGSVLLAGDVERSETVLHRETAISGVGRLSTL